MSTEVEINHTHSWSRPVLQANSSREKNTDPNFLLKVCLIHWVRTVYFLFTPKDVYNEIMLQNRKFRFTLSYELLKSRLKLIIISSSSCCKGKAVMSFLQTTVKNKYTSYINLRQHMIWIVHKIIIAKSRHFWSVYGDSSFGQFMPCKKQSYKREGINLIVGHFDVFWGW